MLSRLWARRPPARSAHPRPVPVYDSLHERQRWWEALVHTWQYRALIRELIARDLRTRYKRSVLGVGWTMMSPLLTMVVLTVVFSHLFRFDLPHYPVYLLSALILWNFFAQSTAAAMQQLLWSGPLLAKIYVPAPIFGVAAVGSGLINLGLALIPLALITIALGVPLRPSLLWLPLATALATMFTLGLGLALSSLAARFRDIVEMYQVVLVAWYFLTPVMYPITILDETSSWWLHLNPLYYLVDVFRTPIYLGEAPATDALLIAAALSIATLAGGWWLFTDYADDLAYQL